jgi:hypothetical protein
MPDGALRAATRRGAAIAIAALVAVTGPWVGVPAASAASCSDGGHVVKLTDGTVAPTSGTTAGKYTFRVTYQSNAGCKPVRVTVAIDGGGVFALAAESAAYGKGVVFSRAVKLTAGRHGYVFFAIAGTGAGRRTEVLAAVKPASIVVEKAVASPKPSPSAAPSASPSASPSPRPSPSPIHPAAGGGGGGFGLPSGPGGGSGRSIFGSGGTSPLLLGLAAATLLSVVLLVVAVGNARRRQQEGGSLEPAVPGATYAETRGIAAPALAPGVRPEEAAIPRWRRPSLREARGATDRGAPPVHMPMRFGSPAGGADRRVVAYRLVRMSSQPDELYGDEVGRLDRGDEVEVIREEAGFYMVIAPDDTVGWVHRTTLTTASEDVVPPD